MDREQLKELSRLLIHIERLIIQLEDLGFNNDDLDKHLITLKQSIKLKFKQIHDEN